MGDSAAALRAGMMLAINAQRASAPVADRARADPRTQRHRAAPRSSRPAPTASGTPMTQADQHPLERAAQDQSRARSAVGAERHAKADLVGPLRDAIGRHAIQPDRRQQQRDDAEQRRPGSPPRVPDRTTDRSARCIVRTLLMVRFGSTVASTRLSCGSSVPGDRSVTSDACRRMKCEASSMRCIRSSL